MQKQYNTPGVFEEFELITSRKKESRLASKTALETVSGVGRTSLDFNSAMRMAAHLSFGASHSAVRILRLFLRFRNSSRTSRWC
jgi:hypothetical protein